MIICSLRRLLSWCISFFIHNFLLNVHCIYILVLINYLILIFIHSLFTMSVVLDHLFKVSNLTNWSIIVLLMRIFLSEALELRSGTNFGNIRFLCTTSLFIWNTSGCMSSFYKLWHLIFLLIEIFQHLRPRHFRSLSSFPKNLWSTFDHLLNWVLSIFMITWCLVILLIWIWLRNIVSILGTMIVSMKIILRITLLFLNWVMNLTNQLATLMSSKAFIFEHASMGTCSVAHDSWWVHNCFWLLGFSGSWCKAIFLRLHLRVLIKVISLSRLVSFIWLLNEMLVVSIPCIWSSTVVVAESSNTFLCSLVATSSSSKKTIWHILSFNYVVWNELMPVTSRSSFFLLWLLHVLSWSSLLLVNVDFEFNSLISLILETIFTFNNLSSILNAKNASVVLNLVIGLVLLILGV